MNCLATTGPGGGKESLTEMLDKNSRIAFALLTLREF